MLQENQRELCMRDGRQVSLRGRSLTDRGHGDK